MGTKFRLITFVSGLFFLAFSIPASALDYYWVGGTGNWSDFANHWATTSGGSTFHLQIPQSADNVYFDVNSFTAPGQIVTIDQTIENVNNFTWNGVLYSPTLAGDINNGINIFGSLQFDPNMVNTFQGLISMDATTPGQYVTCSGVDMPGGITFQGLGGVWTFLDTFMITGGLALTAGTINTGDEPVYAGGFYGYGDSVTAVLNMGASDFYLAFPGSSAGWDWTVIGIKVNAGTSTINLEDDNATFTGGGNTYYNVNFTASDYSYVAYIQDIYSDLPDNFHDVYFAWGVQILCKSTYHDVTIRGDAFLDADATYNKLTLSAGHTYSVDPNATQTLDTLVANGNCNGLIIIQSGVGGYQATISCPAGGNVAGTYLILQDIKATGGASFAANPGIDLGHNTGWNITPLSGRNLYWVGNGGYWADGSHWSLSSGGPPAGCAPTMLDNVFFDVHSFSSAGQIVYIDTPVRYCRDMTWNGALYDPTLSGPPSQLLTSLLVYGSLTLQRAMTFDFQSQVVFMAGTPGNTITSAGQIFEGDVSFSGGGGWTLEDTLSTFDPNLYSFWDIDLAAGTLNTNNQVVMGDEFYSLDTNKRALIMGSSVFDLYDPGVFWIVDSPGLSLSCGTSTINSIDAQTYDAPGFDGGGLTYYNLNFLGVNPYELTGMVFGGHSFHDIFFASQAYIGADNTMHNCTITLDGTISSGNTFNTLRLTAGQSYTFAYGTTNTLDSLVANGNCNNFVTIQSSQADSQAVIHGLNDTNSISYIILQDMKATGNQPFIADNCLNKGDNTGWAIGPLVTQNLYWIGNTGNWMDGNHWSLSSGGPPFGCEPSPADNVIFDVNSFTLPNQVVNVDSPVRYCNNMTWTGVTGNPTLSGSFFNELDIYGSLTLDPNMSWQFGGNVFFYATDTGKMITTSGVYLQSYSISFAGIGGGWTLEDSFSTSASLNLGAGWLRTNNQVVNAAFFYVNNSINVNQLGRLDMGSSVFNIELLWWLDSTRIVFNCGTSQINILHDGYYEQFQGGNETYYDVNFLDTTPGNIGLLDNFGAFHNVTFATTGELQGKNYFNSCIFFQDGNIDKANTFNQLTFSPGNTYVLAAKDTQTIISVLNISGNGGFPVRIESQTPGSPAIFYKEGGLVCPDFIRLSDNKGVGAVFDAGPNSQDLGGNINWNFLGFPGTASLGLSGDTGGVFCAGTNITLNAQPVNGGSSPTYNWLINGESAQYGSSPTFSTSAATGNEIIICEMYSSAYCPIYYGANADTASILVLPNGPPVVTLSADPPGPICPYTRVIFTAAGTGAGNNPQYQFLLNGALMQSGDLNTYSDSAMNNNDVLTCIITGPSLCTNMVTDTTQLIISVTPVTGLTTSSTPAVCGNPNGVAKVNAGTGSFTYNWDDSVFTAMDSGLYGGTYYVTVSNTVCSATDSVIVGTTTVNNPVITADKENLCSGDSAHLCSSGGFVTYQWNNGASTNCIATVQSNDYQLTATDSNGCSATSNIITISIYAVPRDTISTSLPLICASDSSEICSTPGFASYSWNTSDTGKCIEAKQAGDYYVTATDANGCTVQSNQVSISVYPAPSVSITVEGDTLSSFGQIKYQWNLDGQPVPGATDPVFVAKQAGSYTVQVTDTNGCTTTSQPVVLTGISGLSATSGWFINVLPNPSIDGWQLTVNSSLVGSALEVFDEHGQIVFKSAVRSPQSAITLDIASGIYYLRISNANGSVVRKLVKM